METSLGRYEPARRFYEQACLFATIGDRLREGISLNTLGQVYTLLVIALRLRKTGTIAQYSQYHRRPARRGFCLHDMGTLYLARGHAGRGDSLFHVACELRRGLGEIGNSTSRVWPPKGEASLVNGDVVPNLCTLSGLGASTARWRWQRQYPPQNVWWLMPKFARLQRRDGSTTGAPRSANSSLLKLTSFVTPNTGVTVIWKTCGVNAAITASHLS
ncbi:MAG: hypothetical protein U0401_05365 [Anaerolineae bacterium]